jgi:hypothetical protein
LKGWRFDFAFEFSKSAVGSTLRLAREQRLHRPDIAAQRRAVHCHQEVQLHPCDLRRRRTSCQRGRYGVLEVALAPGAWSTAAARHGQASSFDFAFAE